MKTRFCPSPTGFIHLGNVRTAVFNVLLAKKEQGAFLLRIEDTDQLRSDEKFTKQLIIDLHWLGLDWQEGPDIGGPDGPYWQSERQEIYDHYYEFLVRNDKAYPCFCSEQHLAIVRKIQLSSGKAPRYDEACRQLTPEQIKQKMEQGLKPVLRFKIPKNEVLSFNDLVKGEQRFQTNDLGDFIIRRADGTSPFMFCNAIDDALMGVTHVLRGEDHLTNTPRQILILKALELPLFHYAHISLITGNDGSPLSKRSGSMDIKTMREQGYLPSAIVNYLARLGHYYRTNEYMSFNDLAMNFDTKALSSSPAKFDSHHLLHWQKLAVNHTNDESLWEWLGTDIQNLVPELLKKDFLQAVRLNCLFPEKAHQLAQSLFATEIEYNEENKTVLQDAGTQFFKEALLAMEQHGLEVKNIYQHLSQTLGLKGKAIYQPLRIAFTGTTEGPELAIVFHLIGLENIKARLNKLIDSL